MVLALNRLSREGHNSVEGIRRRGIDWLLAAQNPDGGWGGAGGVDSTIEETGLAVQALADALQEARPSPGLAGTSLEVAISKGVSWLVSATRGGRDFAPSPIGLYFSRLWYFEKRIPGHFHRGRPGSRGVQGLSVQPVQHLGRRRRKQVACRVTNDQAYRGGQSRNPHPINPAQRPLQESRDAVEQD